MVVVKRGEEVESRHIGHVAVVDSDGRLLYEWGDPERPTFPRSAMKPFQAIPVVTSGAADRFHMDDADLALCCASHNGEERHRARAQSILERTGQTAAVLACGTHLPRDPESQQEVIRKGIEFTPYFSNCSGKHAGMVATAVHLGEDPEGYERPEHPVQQRILETVCDMTATPREQVSWGVDGCNVPAHRIPLRNLALGFAQMADPVSIGDKPVRRAVERITSAMIAVPEMVAGKNRFCTDLMRAFNGRLAGKVGAEAVYGISDRQRGIGIAVKVEDGTQRALYATVMEVLRQLGLDREEPEAFRSLASYHQPVVKSMSGQAVGKILPVLELKRSD
nr:asparaginase [Desmospora profundinema]